MSHTKNPLRTYKYLGWHFNLINMCYLNYHIFNLHVVDHAFAFKCRDANHYLLQCPVYLTKRQRLLSVIEQLCVVEVQALSFGGSKHSYAENRSIFKSVELFILESN